MIFKRVRAGLEYRLTSEALNRRGADNWAHEYTATSLQRSYRWPSGRGFRPAGLVFVALRYGRVFSGMRSTLVRSRFRTKVEKKLGSLPILTFSHARGAFTPPLRTHLFTPAFAPVFTLLPPPSLHPGTRSHPASPQQEARRQPLHPLSRTRAHVSSRYCT